MEGEVIQEVREVKPTTGSAGLQTQLSGQATTVSALSAASGGIGRGKLFERA